MRIKKFVTICLVVLATVSLNAKINGALQKTINIQGGYSSVASVKVTPIASQAEAYKIGMPFSINDESIMFDATPDGRLIATWNILTNFPFYLDLEAEMLHHYDQDETSNTFKNALGYRLIFVYNLSYYKDGKPIPTAEDRFEINVPLSSKKTKQETGKDLLNKPSDDLSLIGSADGRVFFSLDKTSTDLITSSYDTFPNGNYLATVKIGIRAK